MGQCFGQDGVMGVIIYSFIDIFCLFQGCLTISLGTAVAQWLRCCATNRKVACSIPDGVIGIFH